MHPTSSQDSPSALAAEDSSAHRVRYARLAGAMYLLTVALALFGELFVRSRLLVGESAAQTAANLLQSNTLYRWGLATDLLTFVGVVVLAWALFQLLRGIDSRLAMLALLFRGVELGVHFTAIGLGMVAMSLLGGGEYTQGFSAAQLHGLVGMAIRAQMSVLGIGFIPLGLGSAVFAWLLLRSGFVPRLVAGWGVFASLMLAAYSLGVVLSPHASDYFYLGMLPMLVYELSIGVCLLVSRRV